MTVNGSASIKNYGMLINVSGANNTSGTAENFGINANVANTSTTGIPANNYGVKARACGAKHNFGIYGEVCASGDYAGYFNGDVFTTGTYLPSDENLKQDIQPIENPTEILNSLNPKSYFFQDIENFTLEGTKQYGLLAQDVEETLPELIKVTVLPLETDTLGNITRAEVVFKAIRYNDFIPILIAGFQEQNATVTDQAALITSQNEQIAYMEAQLETQADQLQEIQNQMATVLESVQAMQAKTAKCCNCPTEGSTGAIAPNGGKEMQLGQNVPNPFTNQTRIEFSIPESAAVILEITDETGRPLERLIDAQMTEGGHSVVWNGAGFAPGVYFYTLYANGQLLTKKMIKN